MSRTLRNTTSSFRYTRFRRILLIYILIPMFFGAVTYGLYHYVFSSSSQEDPERLLAIDSPSANEVPTHIAYTLERAIPTLLRIPSINIETTFSESLGLNPDETIMVPESFEEVGWYRYGPTPGELGPAVVLGHVDSYTGPAVFFSLGQLKIGDRIEIVREDESVAHFSVTKLERVAQDTFPTEAVYGNIDHAGLRLITCTGTFDRGEQRYSHNLIVYAELVSEE